MIDVVKNVTAALVASCLLCLSTLKMLGVEQQSGYKNPSFWQWLKRKDNLFFNRLSVLSLCLALSTAITSLCFSFLGRTWALLLSGVPFFLLLFVFWRVDERYALKVPVANTGRLRRLFWIYLLFTTFFSYLLIAVLGFLSDWNGSTMYALVAYVPYALLPICLPVLLCCANAVCSVFERKNNESYVKRAGQVLDEREIIRVAVVGSYGKTSVKNILKTLLSEKYSVVETPASYNTPMGIAKTVFSEEFAGKQVFIAEMGARKEGDIAELCALVRPDYAIFTGVCAQHIASFGSEENVFKEKSEILRCGAKKVVCGARLRTQVESAFEKRSDVAFVGENEIKNLRLSGVKTAFTLLFNGEEIEAEVPLLGRFSAENVALAAALCLEMGLTKEELTRGIAKLEPIPHRLQMTQNGGVYILDDGYNCNIEGAKAALEVLGLYEGRRCVVTPGIVEGGILEEALNGELGKEIAARAFDKVILVGDTLVGAVKNGYSEGGGDERSLTTVKTLTAAQESLAKWLQEGDAVLFLNDLPDVY